jgi:HAD superfamily hydrolase (TIGR01509 family)
LADGRASREHRFAMTTRIRGVFFDLGGTLFSYRNMGRSTGPALLEAAARMGITGDPRSIGKAYGLASREVNGAYAERDFYLHRDLFRDTFVRFVEQMEGQFDEAAYAWFRARQHELVLSGLELKPDCTETLSHLKSEGLYLSIVSNIDDDMLDPLVEREGLHDYLHHWTSSEAAESCKPHRRFFEISLEKSGLAPGEVLFVGDSPEHDVQGAYEVGMNTVLIREEGLEPPLQVGRQTVEPDYTINSLAEIRGLI